MPFTNVQDKPNKIVSGTWYLVSEILTSQTSDLRSQIWRRRRPGFSFVEILLSLFFAAALGTILLTSAGTLSTGYRSNLQSLATKIASKDIENLRKLSFASLPADTGQTCLQDYAVDLSKLPNPCHTRSVSNFQNDADIKQITTTITWYESGEQGCSLSTCVIKMSTLIYKNGL